MRVSQVGIKALLLLMVLGLGVPAYLKISNHKSQIINKFQIPNHKLKTERLRYISPFCIVVFATCGLFDFNFHFGSKREKKVEKKPPTLTVSSEMNRPRITIQEEMHVRETPSKGKDSYKP